MGPDPVREILVSELQVLSHRLGGLLVIEGVAPDLSIEILAIS
jgi:hypothetical protein